MSNAELLIEEIKTLPDDYTVEVLDFVGYLKEKAQNKYTDDIDAYKAMAADTEREREAGEWCNAYFGPVNSKSAHPS